MFYVVTEQGISITEVGQKPLFVGKKEANFDRIKQDIDNLDYKTIKSIIDVKSKIIGYINDNIETYINEDGNIEMEAKLSQYLLEESIKQYVIEQAINGKSDSELSNKESIFVNLLRSDTLRLAKIKVVFE